MPLAALALAITHTAPSVLSSTDIVQALVVSTMSARGAASGGRGGRGRGRKFGANRSTARSGRGKKNSRAMREMRKREPQVVEGEKNLLVFKGPTCSEMMTSVLRDLVRGGCGLHCGPAQWRRLCHSRVPGRCVLVTMRACTYLSPGAACGHSRCCVSHVPSD